MMPSVNSVPQALGCLVYAAAQRFPAGQACRSAPGVGKWVFAVGDLFEVTAKLFRRATETSVAAPTGDRRESEAALSVSDRCL
jgi:hypothetical protein